LTSGARAGGAAVRHVLLGGLENGECPQRERQSFIDNLLVRIHFIIVMNLWTGLAPWESPESLRNLFGVPFDCAVLTFRPLIVNRIKVKFTRELCPNCEIMIKMFHVTQPLSQIRPEGNQRHAREVQYPSSGLPIWCFDSEWLKRLTSGDRLW